MAKTIVYVHGQGGSAGEAAHFRALLGGCDVIGFDYAAATPWEAEEEFPPFFDALRRGQKVTLIANSIGAYFAMCALTEEQIDRACLISPVVDMPRLIEGRMARAGVSEEQLREKGVIATDRGPELSWDYLVFARQHPLGWKVPTHVLWGSRDELTSLETVSRFAARTGATLTVMERGEHWFHTEEQMRFLDRWLQSVL